MTGKDLGFMHRATCLLWDSLPEQEEKPKAIGVTQNTELGHRAALPRPAEQSSRHGPLTLPAPPHLAAPRPFGSLFLLMGENPGFDTPDTLTLKG